VEGDHHSRSPLREVCATPQRLSAAVPDVLGERGPDRVTFCAMFDRLGCPPADEMPAALVEVVANAPGDRVTRRRPRALGASLLISDDDLVGSRCSTG